MRSHRRKPEAAKRIGAVVVAVSVLALATASWAAASGYGRGRPIADCTFTPKRVHLTSTGRLSAGVDISCPKKHLLSSHIHIYKEVGDNDVLVKKHSAAPVEAKTLQNDPTVACRVGWWFSEVWVKVDQQGEHTPTGRVHISHC